MASGGDNLSSASSSTSLNNDDEMPVDIHPTVQPSMPTMPMPATTATALNPELKVENNPDGGIWITSQGVFYFKLNTLHVHLQFFYSTLRVRSSIPILPLKLRSSSC